MDGIRKAQERGVKFGRKREVTAEKIAEIKTLREAGITVPKIMRQTKLSKASVYRALGYGVTGCAAYPLQRGFHVRLVAYRAVPGKP